MVSALDSSGPVAHVGALAWIIPLCSCTRQTCSASHKVYKYNTGKLNAEGNPPMD